MPVTVRLAQTDAAGVVFFARYLELAHEAFEAFVDHLGHPLPRDLFRAEVGYPLVHVEADYRRTLGLGERVTIEVVAERVGRTSFSLRHRFVHADGGEIAVVRLVHAAIDVPSRRPLPLPEAFAAALGQHLEPPPS